MGLFSQMFVKVNNIRNDNESLFESQSFTGIFPK